MAADKRRPEPKSKRGKITLIINNAEPITKFITASRRNVLMVDTAPNSSFFDEK